MANFISDSAINLYSTYSFDIRSFSTTQPSYIITTGASGVDLTIQNINGGLILESGENISDAIYLNASAGGIDIDTATTLDIDSIGAITIDSTSAGLSLDGITSSNFTVTGSGQNLTLASTGGGAQQTIVSSAGTWINAIYLNASAGGIDIDTATTLDIDIGGAITIDSTSAGLSLDGITSSNFTVTGSGQSLTLSSVGGGVQQTIVSSAGTGINAIYL